MYLIEVTFLVAVFLKNNCRQIKVWQTIITVMLIFMTNLFISRTEHQMTVRLCYVAPHQIAINDYIYCCQVFYLLYSTSTLMKACFCTVQYLVHHLLLLATYMRTYPMVW